MNAEYSLKEYVSACESFSCVYSHYGCLFLSKWYFLQRFPLVEMFERTNSASFHLFNHLLEKHCDTCAYPKKQVWKQVCFSLRSQMWCFSFVRLSLPQSCKLLATWFVYSTEQSIIRQTTFLSNLLQHGHIQCQ